MKNGCCAFTGHRPKKFPWGYNEADPRCIALKQALTKEISKLAKDGYTDFLSGMAEGVDTWAALEVLALSIKEADTIKNYRWMSSTWIYILLKFQFNPE